MSNFTEPVNDGLVDELHQYRALSSMSVISLALGLLSLAALPFAIMLVVPAVGAFVGITAVRQVKSRQNELTGLLAARIGLALSVLLLVGGAGMHSYIYATEVPDGHQRIAFMELQPDDRFPSQPIPPFAQELDGKRVFIKGYVYPDGQQKDIKKFVLIPDMGTCCFGGQPKITDMIEVTLKDPLRVDYSYARRKLAGVLKVDLEPQPVSGLGGVHYRLEADYAK